MVQQASPRSSLLVAALRRRVLAVFPRGQNGMDYDHPVGDVGLFGPDSATWRVHADFPGMLAGGLCALMLQALHPRVLAGVWDHSDFRDDLVGRMRRTTTFVAATSFAGRADAERLIRRVQAIHRQVRGVTEDGQAYAADAPDLLAWVHASEAYAFLAGFEAFSGLPLPESMATCYLEEGRRVALALGASDVPGDCQALSAYFASQQSQLRFDHRAREVLEVLAHIRLPVPGAVIGRELFLGAGAALLPAWARAMMGVTPLQRARHLACAGVLRGAAPLFRLALPDGAGSRACRRVGASPELLRVWPPEAAG